eukprot:1921580-Rhodomonas_salina.1
MLSLRRTIPKSLQPPAVAGVDLIEQTDYLLATAPSMAAFMAINFSLKHFMQSVLGVKKFPHALGRAEQLTRDLHRWACSCSSPVWLRWARRGQTRCDFNARLSVASMRVSRRKHCAASLSWRMHLLQGLDASTTPHAHSVDVLTRMLAAVSSLSAC